MNNDSFPTAKNTNHSAAGIPVIRRFIRSSAVLVGILLFGVGGCSKAGNSATNESNTQASGANSPPTNNTDKTTGDQAPVEAEQVVVAADAVTPENSPAGDTSYALVVEAPKTVAVGATGTVVVKVEPKTGWKMNDEFPTALKVAAPPDVTLEKPVQKLADAASFAKNELVFKVNFTPGAAGEKQFSAKFKFAVCTDTTCDPKKHNLAWKITAE